MPYDGFISYSHATDGRLAPAFQRGLQLLAKPWNSRRALRIFRDETGLSTNPHLWSAIEKAMDESQWFVLLASEDGAQSEWVNKEISHWLATKSVDQILPVVTDGTWEWDPDIGDFVPESSAVPEALRGALRDEPRHLDMRWARDETDLDMRNSQFRSAVADLAAPMHGVAKDELEGEDIRQHRRARRFARGAMGLVSSWCSRSCSVSSPWPNATMPGRLPRCRIRNCSSPSLKHSSHRIGSWPRCWPSKPTGASRALTLATPS